MQQNKCYLRKKIIAVVKEIFMKWINDNIIKIFSVFLHNNIYFLLSLFPCYFLRSFLVLYKFPFPLICICIVMNMTTITSRYPNKICIFFSSLLLCCYILISHLLYWCCFKYYNCWYFPFSFIVVGHKT